MKKNISKSWHFFEAGKCASSNHKFTTIHHEQTTKTPPENTHFSENPL